MSTGRLMLQGTSHPFVKFGLRAFWILWLAGSLVPWTYALILGWAVLRDLGGFLRYRVWEMDAGIAVLWMLSIALVLMPFAYHFATRPKTVTRLRVTVWSARLGFSVCFLIAYGIFAHPLSPTGVSSDERLPPDSAEFWWKYFYPYYIVMTVLTVTIPFPAVVYWVRRFRKSN